MGARARADHPRAAPENEKGEEVTMTLQQQLLALVEECERLDAKATKASDEFLRELGDDLTNFMYCYESRDINDFPADWDTYLFDLKFAMRSRTLLPRLAALLRVVAENHDALDYAFERDLARALEGK